MVKECKDRSLILDANHLLNSLKQKAMKSSGSLFGGLMQHKITAALTFAIVTGGASLAVTKNLQGSSNTALIAFISAIALRTLINDTPAPPENTNQGQS